MPPDADAAAEPYRTIRGVQVLGLAELDGSTDPQALVANTNRRAASGRPPGLQLGHTPTVDVSEDRLPRHVGFVSGFKVDGDWILGDLSYLANEFDTASTYPRLSVERVKTTEPEPYISRIALLRGVSEARSGSRTVTYGAERPAPSVPEARGGRFADPRDVEAAYRVARELNIHPVTAYGRLLSGRLRDGRGRVVYARDSSPVPTASAGRPHADPGLIAFATKKGITNLVEARRLYDLARSRGEG